MDGLVWIGDGLVWIGDGLVWIVGHPRAFGRDTLGIVVVRVDYHKM